MKCGELDKKIFLLTNVRGFSLPYFAFLIQVARPSKVSIESMKVSVMQETVWMR